jgi:hypothetical protein
MLIRSHHSLRQAELETATMGGQQGPPCQQRPPVNRRKRRIGRENIGLQREPRGSVLDPGNRVFKPENTTALSTCEMFGITRMAGRDAVNKKGAAIWGWRVLAPQNCEFRTHSPENSEIAYLGARIVTNPNPRIGSAP